jgi:LCP family protein required for cell wall assembly
MSPLPPNAATPPATPPSPVGRRPRRRPRPWPRIALGILAAAVVGVGIAIWRAGGAAPLAEDVLGTALASVYHPAVKGPVLPYDMREPLTVLVMGTEKTAAFGGTQTDSMMVLAYDPAKHSAAILSVPRDLWVNIPGYGPQRINSALEFGGPATAELTVEEYVGVPIEYYAIVDYSALVQLVNDVGGITVYNPYNIDDTCFPNAAENACTVFRLSKGYHHLDGEMALKFARERETLPLSDLSRDADQQRVLLALKQALLQPQNLLKLPRLVSDIEQSVITNLPVAELPRIAAQVLHLPAGAIQRAVLQYSNGAVSNYTTPGGAEVLLPHEAAIHQVVSKLFAPELAALQGVPIQLEASSTGSSTAATVSQVLSGFGLDVLPTSSAPATSPATTSPANSHVYWNTAMPLQARDVVAAKMVAGMLGTTADPMRLPSVNAPVVAVLGGAGA